jgi:hypothetical protein
VYKNDNKNMVAVDACGNSSNTVSQTITQVDTQAPTIGAAGANATIECTATPVFTAPTATDACNAVTVNQVGGDITGGNSCAKNNNKNMGSSGRLRQHVGNSIANNNTSRYTSANNRISWCKCNDRVHGNTGLYSTDSNGRM